MADVIEVLRPHERRKVSEIAEAHGKPVEVVAAGIVSAWLALADDAPGALPPGPMQGLKIKGRGK